MKDEHTSKVYISDVLTRKACSKHEAEQGKPCWRIITSDTGEFLNAICNNRARRAGYKAKVSYTARTGKKQSYGRR